MSKFTDSTGRNWDVAITIGDMRRVKKARPEVDLLNMLVGKEQLIVALNADLELFCDVLFLLLEPQAQAISVTDEMFGTALGGAAIRDAHKAFWESMTSFFTEMGQTELAEAIGKMLITIEHQRMLATERIRQIDHLKICGSLSGNSPAS